MPLSHEYCVLHAEALSELVGDVSAAMQNGWKPQGGVMARDARTPIGFPMTAFYQAMTKSSVKEECTFEDNTPG